MRYNIKKVLKKKNHVLFLSSGPQSTGVIYFFDLRFIQYVPKVPGRVDLRKGGNELLSILIFSDIENYDKMMRVLKTEKKMKTYSHLIFDLEVGVYFRFSINRFRPKYSNR